MMGGTGSGRKKEGKGDINLYKPSSLSGKYFTSLITNTKPSKPDISEKTQLDNIFEENKKLIKDKLESWALIQKAEAARMPKDVIDEMKLQMGIVKPEEVEEESEGMTAKEVMLIKLVGEEEDPQMKQLYTMMLFGGKKGAMDPSMMAMMMNNKSKGESFESKLAMKFLEEKMDKKSDIEKGMEYFTKMTEMRDKFAPDKNWLDEMIKEKDKLIDLGIVSDPQGNIEDRKLDLEFKKLDLDHNRITKIEEGKLKTQEEIMNSVKMGVTALLGSIGHITKMAHGSDNKSDSAATGNKRMFKCSNPDCGLTFPIVLDSDRTVLCPKTDCQWSYVIQKGEIYTSEETEEKLKNLEDSSRSNEHDQK